jgi:hypothetical protein
VIDHIHDHVDQGLDRLLDQFRDKPRLGAWLRSLLRQCQLFEDAVYDVIVKRLIDNAEAEQLNVIGRVVGEPRRGREDAIYRLFIRARIRINRSMGAAKDVLDVLQIIAPEPALFDETPPASMSIEFAVPPAQDPSLLYGMLRDTKAGGVGLTMVAATTVSNMQFRWSSVEDANDPNLGFGDANATGTSGLLADAVTMRSAA